MCGLSLEPFGREIVDASARRPRAQSSVSGGRLRFGSHASDARLDVPANVLEVGVGRGSSRCSPRSIASSASRGTRSRRPSRTVGSSPLLFAAAARDVAPDCRGPGRPPRRCRCDGRARAVLCFRCVVSIPSTVPECRYVSPLLATAILAFWRNGRDRARPIRRRSLRTGRRDPLREPSSSGVSVSSSDSPIHARGPRAATLPVDVEYILDIDGPGERRPRDWDRGDPALAPRRRAGDDDADAEQRPTLTRLKKLAIERAADAGRDQRGDAVVAPRPGGGVDSDSRTQAESGCVVERRPRRRSRGIVPREDPRRNVKAVMVTGSRCLSGPRTAT